MFLYDILLAMATGLVTSFVMIWILQLRKPKIRISDRIVRRVDEKTGEPYFQLKILNKGRGMVIDCHVEAFRVYHAPNVQGKVTPVRKRLTIRTRFPLMMGRINLSGQAKGIGAQPSYLRQGKLSPKQVTASHVLRFEEDLFEICKQRPNAWVSVRVRGRDSLSNTLAMFQQDYNLNEHVIDGRFAPGDTLDVVEKKAEDEENESV